MNAYPIESEWIDRHGDRWCCVTIYYCEGTWAKNPCLGVRYRDGTQARLTLAEARERLVEAVPEGQLKLAFGRV